MTQSPQTPIEDIVERNVRNFASAFEDRLVEGVADPGGTINMKRHNVFIEALGPEIRYYSSLSRSLDSSLGNMIQAMALDLATARFEVRTEVAGTISQSQLNEIADLVAAYAEKTQRPSVADVDRLRSAPKRDTAPRSKTVDYYFIERSSGDHMVIELKAGGNLDSKKARAEREALLERYLIVSNDISPSTSLKSFFATGYNMYGDREPWIQSSVRQYFSDDELLIGRDFWNFIIGSETGYDDFLRSYRKHSTILKEALDRVREAYLK